jgi:uncharacterized protein (TIGR02099 family)
MSTFFRKLAKAFAYTAAGIVILLAVAVGLFRLFLPRLPEYQDEIKTWASRAIGVEVEFSGMDARWGLRGPELKFYEAELSRPGGDTRLLAVEEVGIGVSLVRLLVDRALVVDTVSVSDTSVELRLLEDGSWRIQQTALEDLPKIEAGGAGEITLIGENIDVSLLLPNGGEPTEISISTIVTKRDATRLAIDATLGLSEALGREATVSAMRLLDTAEPAAWNLFIETDDLNLEGLSALLPDELPAFGGGAGDVGMALAVRGGTLESLTANIDIAGVTLGDGPAFDARGRLTVSNDASGWLVAAEEFEFETGRGAWPRSTLRVETGTDADGGIVMLDAEASYLNLSDVDVFLPWLPDDLRRRIGEWQPDGVLRDLVATLSDIGTDDFRYSVSAALDGAGFAAVGTRPGVRGFSGALRADHEGGLLEINAGDLILDLAAWVPDLVPVERAEGTVIWRRGDERTTILSDSIVISNAFFDSETNVEVVIDGDASPVVDLSSSWRIDSVSEARRYIPERVMAPQLYDWFQQALVSGRLTDGSTRLNGALDDFPFDDGTGRLLIEADVRDMRFRYLRDFPAAEVAEMHVVLDNTRLYTKRNRSQSAGNLTIDADVEIADLRQPVLTIDADSTGTLETIRQFALESPISRVFGGQLDRVTVSGDAAFTLDLRVPLLDWRSFDFTTRITTSNGRLEIDALRPPITELAGSVTVGRETVSSEALSGTFLGAPVSIELTDAPAELDGYRVVATAIGEAAATDAVAGFALPLAEHVDGRLAYRAEVLFPAAQRNGGEPPAAFSVNVASDLEEVAVDLPPPFGKPAGSMRVTSASLTLPPGGDAIRTQGRAGAAFAWQLGFERTSSGWDLDRGALLVGEGEPTVPDLRGLHVTGRLDRFALDEWLALAGDAGGGVDVISRIRSVDLAVDDLYLVGQHLRNHRVSVDRSARDWLVQFEGDAVIGSAFVPYDFDAGRALVLDMERLHLPGDGREDEADPQAAGAPGLDPRTLPALEVRAADFALGERSFGALDTVIAKTPDGLVADSIVATAPTFEIDASGRWVHDGADPRGSRTFLDATLASSNVETTLKRLGYQPGIESDSMNIRLELDWSGGPRGDFLDTLDGRVQVRLGTGQLNEVEPGAGRVFGLMSIVALPRRLSLDFRDVFQKGFGFDTISGTFRIEDGTAYTCDLSLEGPAANIGIIGEVGLAARSYSQAAVVSANVGNTLPVVGAIAAGPQAAAVMFLFSQIFKEPLADIGQIYYRVSGSWDNPAVENASADAFAAAGRAAGCLEDSG